MASELEILASGELGKCAVILSAEAQSFEPFPNGWGIKIDVANSTDLGSEKSSELLSKLKDAFGFVLLVSETAWECAGPVFEQVQQSEDLQVPHLEYIHVPTCVIYVPAGNPIRKSQTLLLAEEVFKSCLMEFADEVDEEVVKHNGNFRLPSWINSYASLRNDSERFNEILEEGYLNSAYIHDWAKDSGKTQILIICNSDDQPATTYHCRFSQALDLPRKGVETRNLMIKKLDHIIQAGDFVRAGETK